MESSHTFDTIHTVRTVKQPLCVNLSGTVALVSARPGNFASRLKMYKLISLSYLAVFGGAGVHLDKGNSNHATYDGQSAAVAALTRICDELSITDMETT